MKSFLDAAVPVINRAQYIHPKDAPNIVWCVLYRDKRAVRGEVNSLWELMTFSSKQEATRLMVKLVTNSNPVYTLYTVDIASREPAFGDGDFVDWDVRATSSAVRTRSSGRDLDKRGPLESA